MVGARKAEKEGRHRATPENAQPINDLRSRVDRMQTFRPIQNQQSDYTGANGYLFQGFQGNLLGQQDLFSNRTLWHNSDMLDAASSIRKKVLLPKETHWPAKDKTQTRDVSTKSTSTRL